MENPLTLMQGKILLQKRFGKAAGLWFAKMPEPFAPNYF
jgi:hypothetical protein